MTHSYTALIEKPNPVQDISQFPVIEHGVRHLLEQPGDDIALGGYRRKPGFDLVGGYADVGQARECPACARIAAEREASEPSG